MGLHPTRPDMIKQEAMKPGNGLIMASRLLNHSLPFSGFHGFLLKL
jgi:hypothetical protein